MTRNVLPGTVPQPEHRIHPRKHEFSIHIHAAEGTRERCSGTPSPGGRTSSEEAPIRHSERAVSPEVLDCQQPVSSLEIPQCLHPTPRPSAL